MKPINKFSTKIFCELLDKMRGKDYLKIVNEPFMPLSMERIGGIYWQDGKLLALAHYYDQHGDLMADPEMCFIVVDQREKDKTDMEKVMIVPYLYKQDNMGIYEESLLFKNDVVAHCDANMQLQHVLFANQWLQNIVEQGFLKNGNAKTH